MKKTIATLDATLKNNASFQQVLIDEWSGFSEMFGHFLKDMDGFGIIYFIEHLKSMEEESLSLNSENPESSSQHEAVNSDSEDAGLQQEEEDDEYSYQADFEEFAEKRNES